MSYMSDHEESPSRDLCKSSQLTNSVLDSGATCHMNPHFSDFIPGLLEDRDKHIEIADRHQITSKQKDKYN